MSSLNQSVGRVPLGILILCCVGLSQCSPSQEIPVEPALPPMSEVSFQAADGLEVTADYYRGVSDEAPVVVLFHQSMSSRGEYRAIAPRLQALGYHALAVDLRWGGARGGVTNETSARHGTASIVTQVEAGTASPWPTIDGSYQDMQAALVWLDTQGLTGRRYVLGSSFSAMLVFKLAAEVELAGVMAYSPGEYDEARPTLVRGWAAQVTEPVLSVAAVDEADLVRPVADAATARGSRLVQAQAGRHGASILDEDDRNWLTLTAFLGQQDGGPPRREEVAVDVSSSLTVTLDRYDVPGSSATIVLFHQGGGSARGEYGFLIPRLVEAGVSVIAPDLQGGGDLFGVPNRTLQAFPEADSFHYCDALPQVKAVLALARQWKPGGRLIAWGSSYSGALVLHAVAGGDVVDRVAVFSPATGEPMGPCAADLVADQIPVPLLVVRPDTEASIPAVAAQLATFRQAGHQVLVAAPGAHGSSTLNDLRVAGDVSGAWATVRAFLGLN